MFDLGCERAWKLNVHGNFFESDLEAYLLGLQIYTHSEYLFRFLISTSK